MVVTTETNREVRTLPFSYTHFYKGFRINLSVINFSKQINLSSALTSIHMSLNASQVGTVNACYTFLPTLPRGRNSINNIFTSTPTYVLQENMLRFSTCNICA